MWITSIPMFLYLYFLYNALAFAGKDGAVLARNLLETPLMSGAVFVFAVEDALMCAGVIMLFIEIYRSSRPGGASVVKHGLAVVTLIAFIVEFVVARQVGRASFFILGLMASLDVIAGFTISVTAARRDVSIGTG